MAGLLLSLLFKLQPCSKCLNGLLNYLGTC